MSSHKVISDILHIPRDFHKLKNVSIYTLLKESGYFEIHSLISVEAIRMLLISEPKCYEEWLAYSKDKRCNSGWYFTQEEKHKYIVGYYPSRNKSSLSYEDPLEACSVFIKKEIENIRLCG